MKEELKKSLRTYGALLLLGVTGVPLGAAVGLIEALFCRLLLKVTAVRVAHLFWCLPFLAMAGLVIVAVNQKFGGRGKGGMSLIFDVAYEEETELPLRMIPLSMLSTALTHLFGGSAGREGVAVQIGAVFSYFAGKKLPFKNAPGIFLVTGMAAGFAGMFGTPIAAVIFAVEVLAAGEMRYEALLPAFTASFSASAVASLLGIRKENLAVHISESLTPFLLVRLITLGIIFGITGGLFAWCLKHTKKYLGEKIKNPLVRVFSIGVILSILFLLLYRGRYCGFGTNLVEAVFHGEKVYAYDWALKFILTILTLSAGFQGGEVTPLFTIGATLGAVLGNLFGIPVELSAALGYAAVFWRRNQHLTGGYFHWRRDFWLRLSAIFLYCLHRGLRIQPQQLDLFPPETDEIQLLITETSQSYHTPLRVTVHWCPANCNIRNLHLKFCFAKGGLLTPETCSYAAKQQVFHC